MVQEYLVWRCRGGSKIKKLKCDTYVSSPVAKNYLDEEMFLKQGIKVEWYKYSETLNNLSIIDYLFNTYDN